jgi:hypothetical protein
MPLRAPEGNLVVLERPSLRANFLNIPSVLQEQSQWCWAACAVMVLRYYGLGVRGVWEDQ